MARLVAAKVEDKRWSDNACSRGTAGLEVPSGGTVIPGLEIALSRLSRVPVLPRVPELPSGCVPEVHRHMLLMW